MSKSQPNPAIKELFDSLTPVQQRALLAEAAKAAARGQATDYSTESGIVRFAREKLHADPAPYQERILSALVRERRVAVRSPHGAGKTALAAWVVLWALETLGDDVKVITTASNWRQLVKFLWPEIRKFAGRASFEQRPRVLDAAIKYDDLTSREAFAVASDNPYLIEGAHAAKIVYVLDEAKAIPADMWDAIEGALSTGDFYVLAISTPGAADSRFYDIHSHKPGYQDWHTEHVTLAECIEAGRISQKWADARKAQWGENSPVYITRVLGEFADSTEDCLIPLAWVEAANERFAACNGKGDGAAAYGVDPARFGEDKTAIARLVGKVCERLNLYSQQSTMETAGRVAASVDKVAQIAVDVIGLGAGVYDRLKEQQFNVIPVQSSEAARDPSGQPLHDKSGQLEFVNKRSYLWWILREALSPDNPDALALPPDDRLTGDLTAPHWTYNSTGKVIVESKDDLRKRLGRSTDAADALALAIYAKLDDSSYLFGQATIRSVMPEGIFGEGYDRRASFTRKYW